MDQHEFVTAAGSDRLSLHDLREEFRTTKFPTGDAGVPVLDARIPKSFRMKWFPSTRLECSRR